MKEENKKIILFGDAVQAVEAGFKPCSGCADEYKKTEEK
jgi:methylphosphotriester-DNA--protein-cysteine methyltransferase